MSRGDTLCGYVSDYDVHNAFDHELSVSPSWSVQNIAFSLGLHGPLKAKIEFPKSAAPQPPIGVEGTFDCGRDIGYRLSLCSAHEHGFYSPFSLGYGGAPEEFVGDSFEGLGGPTVPPFRRPLDNSGYEVEQSSSSNDVENFADGDMDLPFAFDPEGSNGVDARIGDGHWDGVVELVHELAAHLGESPIAHVATEFADHKPARLGLDHHTSAPDFGAASLDKDDRKGNCPGSPDEIMNALSAIQKNVEKMKAVVPRLSTERHRFTQDGHKQAAAAAGAVKLISQLADAAVSIIPEIQRQVDEVGSGKTPSDFDKDQKFFHSATDPGFSSTPGLGSVESSGQSHHKTFAGKASTSRNSSVGLVTGESSTPVGDSKLALLSGGGPELGHGIGDYSSLVTDLLASGIPGPEAIKLLTGELWSGKLSDALKLAAESSLGSESLPFENPDNGPAGASQEDLGTDNNGVALSAAQDGESDEGDTSKGSELPAGSYILMEIDDLEILTEQTHFCNICCKGFKRDANLRMHMRSHGGKFKTSTALVRTEKPPKVAQEMVDGKPTRYSCPYLGCNRNVKHPKFQALKTMLCLKNHYRRSHCPKTLKCSICKSKQFSVVADLRTHEKHCGSDRWACSCGTTFSRKEKLYGHISLFVGHIPMDATMAMNVVTDMVMSSSAGNTQIQGVAAPEHSQGIASQADTSSPWHGWKNISDNLYKD